MKIRILSTFFLVVLTLGRKAPTLHMPLFPLPELQQHDSGRPSGVETQKPHMEKQELPHAQLDSRTKDDQPQASTASDSSWVGFLASQWADEQSKQTSPFRHNVNNPVPHAEGDITGTVDGPEKAEHDEADATNATESSWGNFLASPWAAADETAKPQELLLPQHLSGSDVDQERHKQSTEQNDTKVLANRPHLVLATDVTETISHDGFLASRNPSVTTKQSRSSDLGSHEVEMSVRALAYELILGFEIVVALIIYALIGTFAATFFAGTFRCSWRRAMLANIMWPVSMCFVMAAMILECLKRRNTKQPNHAFDCFSTVRLQEAFGAEDLITPQRISEEFDMPSEKALRWHRWFAAGKQELSLKMMLVKAAELHAADGKQICGILFDVHFGDGGEGFSMKDVADVLESWCIRRYGEMCKCGGVDELIQILMGHLEVRDSGNITQAEWMQLSSVWPELFDSKSPSPAHVSYLKLLCRARMATCQMFEASV